MAIEREIYIVIRENGEVKNIVPIAEEQLAQIDLDVRPVIARNVSTGKEQRFESIKDAISFINVYGADEETMYNDIKEVIGQKDCEVHGYAWIYEETIVGKKVRAGKRVRCIELNIIFNSKTEAERAVGLSAKSRIGNTTGDDDEQFCSGLHGGFHWEQLD